MSTALYFVECQFRDGTSAFVERDPNDMDRKTTLHMIVGGEWDRVVRVLEIIPDEGHCRDVSEDFARDIAAQREPLREDLIRFIDRHAGRALALEMVAA